MSDEVNEKAQLAPIVIDNGSNTIKAGFGGDKVPQTVFRCASSNFQRVMVGMGTKSVYIGDEAIDREGRWYDYRLIYPIKNGIVSNWDSLGGH